ncbi:alginate lyase family protein [Roseibacterium beibuensis]|uniref:Glycosyltransferase n=1 Tax=[Roseibacterium] beibuensis TaxID=1193142 RepID=A0ABP9LFX5_9RHOB|nr:alginate lyase family protein [Roseibacterium beibuensis]MCS6623231.1 alginate lyase family protein [Roseibacterium beibuensis]
MTKSEKSGKTPAAKPSPHSFQTTGVYYKLAEKASEEHVVEIGWSSARTPAPVRAHEPVPEDLAAAWPTWPHPRKALTPRTGNNSPQPIGSVGVMFVALFGLNAEQIAGATASIQRRYRTARNFRPLFLTDNPDTSAFRHAGLTYEYFPKSVFGGEDRIALFEARFQRLWRKWRGSMLIDFSKAGFLSQRLSTYGELIDRETAPENRYDPRKARPAPPKPAPTDVIALQAAYRASGLDQEPDNFVLYRIIGNDLPPRHELGQTLRNVQFILENEPPLKLCEKRWVVNRIADPDQEAAVIALLERHGQPYLHIPFVLEDYAETDWDLCSFPDPAFFLHGRYDRMTEYDQKRAEAHAQRFKNNYVINNNGARNAALRDGRDRAKWVLPWDGNCFLTEAAWDEIVEGVTTRPYLKYFTVPMSRTLDNADLLDPHYSPEADEEPQILFRRDSEEEFNEAFYYGRRPKVELFYRLAIPGKWDAWADDAWDLPRADRSPDAGTTGQAGWVARLFSGQTQLEADKITGLRSRGEARISAISQMLERLDIEAMRLVYDPATLVAYDEEVVKALATADPKAPEHRVRDRLLAEAELALQRGPYSVTQKTTVAPSGDPHDYYHPAPYWWPNPATSNGMPFIFRDGERIPGTRLYEPDSARYDRTRLQQLFDDTTTLSLAWLASGREAYIAHAAQLIRTWFLDPATRMNPHLLYAQIRSQTMRDIGSKSGLIEMKDLYYFLDAVRLVERAGKLADAEKEAFRAWLREYAEWLQTSDQGVAEHDTSNNHGTCYDLQVGSIAAFLGDAALLQKTLFTSRERILEQFTKDGQQPHEMKRTQTAHYCCFNLQSWVNLASLADACGHALWTFEGPDGRGMAKAFDWLLPLLAQATWKYQQIEPFDRGRFLPLFYAARAAAGRSGGAQLSDSMQARPLFFPHDGIKPFWMLGRTPSKTGDTGAWKTLAGKLRRLEPSAFEMVAGTKGASREERDVPTLDKKLWGGFSANAIDALETVRDDPKSTEAEVNRAARILARWHFTHGDFAETLANVDRIGELGPTGDRERSLLKAYCLQKLDRTDEAAGLLRELLRVFPKDTGLCLAMAGIDTATEGDARTLGFSAWINRAYKNAGLPDFLAEDADAALSLRQTVQQSATQPDSHRRTGSVVSVIVPIDAPSPSLPLSLKSLRLQSWPHIEVIIVDHSGDPGVKGAITDAIGDDPRFLQVHLPVTTPSFEARNIALTHATGRFVTVQNPTDIAHPARLELQVTALEDEDVPAVVVQRACVTKEAQLLGGWFPNFSLVGPDRDSLMLSTERLRDYGGWDNAAVHPENYLIWRLKHVEGKDAVETVQPGVPIILTVAESSFDDPTHLEFPYGPRRDRLRALLRAARNLAFESDEAKPPAAISFPTLSVDEKLDCALVGDFSKGATAIDELRAFVAARVANGEKVGLFNWPDYHSTWREDLDPEIAEMVDGGQVAQISAFTRVAASRLILCNPYVIHNQVDGLPEFDVDEFEVLGDPGLNLAEFHTGVRRIMPTKEEIQSVFDFEFSWRAL